jgi:peroxiredoxin
MGIHVGQAAPDFCLKSSEMNDVKLSDYRGRNVVLLFFPLAFTGVCTKELCSIRDEFQEYQDLDTEILAISIDSPFTLARFKSEQHYNFPLLSDFNKEVSKKYEAYYNSFMEMNGVAKRAAFVIDKSGIVRYAEVLEDAHDLPDFKKVKETLQSLK